MASPSPAPAEAQSQWKGNDSALLGIVFGIIGFWLFAQTALNLGHTIAGELSVSLPLMNIAISLPALFSGMFIVVFGGLADIHGRKKVVFLGNLANIIGSLLIAFAVTGTPGLVMLIVGRVLQGLGAGSIMPASMAILKTYWHGKQRQRAVSMWSIGSWGGGGLCSILGGALSTTTFGWRSVFVISAIVSLLSILLLRQVPETAPAASQKSYLDLPGIVSFVVAMIALQVIVTQGESLGWTSTWVLVLILVFICAFGFFVYQEVGNRDAFVDFRLFKNWIFTGATLSNFLLNATFGIVSVTMWVLQDAAGMSPARAGYLTIGYAVFIIAFIRYGEKVLQLKGPRFPMILASCIVLMSIAVLRAGVANLEHATWLVIIGFTLYGLGLAFYATPSTDAALTSLPQIHAGAGAGIYKMASSLGAAFGVATSSAIYTAISATRVQEDFIHAGMVGLGYNAILCLVALVIIIVFVPGKAVYDKQAEASEADVAS